MRVSGAWAVVHAGGDAGTRREIFAAWGPSLSTSETPGISYRPGPPEITTSQRGLAAEVPVPDDVGLDEPSVINCDGIHTIGQRSLTTFVGHLDADAMDQVCSAVAYAIGC